MKKLYILLLAAMACGLAQAQAQDNAFYFNYAYVMPGQMVDIDLCLKNKATDLTCIEAEIQLPEGLVVATDEEGTPIISLYRNRVAEHEILANVLDNGNLKLLISSMEGKTLRGESGPILSFLVLAEEDAPICECNVQTVGESLLVNTAAEAYYSVGVQGYVLITDDPTALKDLKESKDLNGAIYNLAGQRVSKTKNGIFIRSGKKELHK